MSTNTWQALPIGAGGFLTGLSIAQDGTMVVRTDTYGAYIWNGTEWQQLITATSMPAAFVAHAQLYNHGVYEIQVAPSNSSVMYMVYDVFQANTYPPLVGVYKSTDHGATWTQTSFTPIPDTTLNANGPYRTWGQKMAVDPANPNIVYFGTGANGLYVTTDGGNTWSTVSGVPAATSDGSGNYPGITGILFDPANTNIIFAASYGNGIYETTNGGVSWSKLSGGPSTVAFAAISSNGTYFAIDANHNLWVDAGGKWTEPLVASGQAIAGVAVDPFNPNHIVATLSNGQLNESFNSGSSWSGWSQTPTNVANDIPYQAVYGPNANGLAFSPTTPGEIFINGSRSFWTTTLSGNVTTSTIPTWTDQGIGIEQLVANEIIVPPVANSTPIVASWDTAVISPNGSHYVSSFGPVQNGNVVAGWSIDYASSDPNFIVVLADGGYAGGPQESGYSTNDGQTWTAFPTLPPGGSFGGNIAASTPSNIIFASAGNQPYYTLDGGNTWHPISLPGVSNWSNFIGAFFSDHQVITADRVLANTFYLLDSGVGVFKTTDGGVDWTLVNSSVTQGSQLISTPGKPGDLWLAAGFGGNAGNQGTGGPLLHSTDGGSTWTTIANVVEPYTIGFGAAAPGQSYPAIYMVGWVNNVYGVWQSINEAQSWTQIGTWPNGSLDLIKTISGDPNVFGKVYVGFAGSGYAVYSADGPSVLEIDTSPSSSLGQIGTVVTLKLAMSEVTTVAGGTPTLTLNDGGGTATYVGGSGTDALTFSYTVAAGQNTSGLAATAINLNGATITDSGGNAANLSLTGLTQAGPQVDTMPATVNAVAHSASSVLEPGATETLTLNMSEVVNVNTIGGTPTLTLNDGGTATYTGGSGTNALTFSYTVGAGQNTSSLAATAVNLNGATISNANGAANLSLNGLTQSGPQIDGTLTLAIDGNGFFSAQGPTSSSINVGLTTANPNDVIILNIAVNGPTVASVSDTAGLTWQERAVTGISGQLLYQYYAIAPHALSVDTITANFTATPSYVGLNAFGIAGANTSSPFDTNASIPATASSGTVSASTSEANDLIFAAYRFYVASPGAGSGWTAIQAGSAGVMSEYRIVSAPQSGLVATASTTGENGGILDAVVQAATQTTGPTVSSVSATAGDYDAGKVVKLTLNLTEAVTVAGATPTLTLNDGGTATYTGGSGTNTLTFSYTVGAGQNTTQLQVTAINGTITDAGGNALNTANLPETFSGVTIDTTTPVISAIAESPSSGQLNAGKTVAYTITMSEPVTVSGGPPTLSLNDGGTATYTGGSGTNALTFSYTVLAGQNTPDLLATAFNLNGAAVLDGAGNAANVSLTGVAQGSPVIDTTAPAAPVIISDTILSTNQVTLTGTALDQKVAEAGDLIQIYNGTTLLGTTTTNASGGWSYTTPPLSNGTYVLTATVTDLAGNTSAASQAVNPTITESGPETTEAPQLTVSSSLPPVHPGGSIPMGITAMPVDSDDTVSITIKGVPSYETITAGPGEIVTRNSSTYTITSTIPGASITDLTLTSSYKGKKSVTSTFTVTASNTTSGEKATSPAKTVTVTDPPILTANENIQGITNSPTDLPTSASFGLATAQETVGGEQLGGAPPRSPPSLDHVVALFNQFIAAGFPDQHGAPISNALSQIATNEEQFLAPPHHG
jgi:hypothetical protein